MIFDEHRKHQENKDCISLTFNSTLGHHSQSLRIVVEHLTLERSSIIFGFLYTGNKIGKQYHNKNELGAKQTWMEVIHWF